MPQSTFNDHDYIYGEYVHVTRDIRELLWVVSLEAPMTTSTWQCGILRALCSSRSDTMFSLTSPSFFQGVSSCFCPYRRATALVQVNYNLKTNVTKLAFQLKRHLLRGPHPVGSSTSPSCRLPASAWVCPCTNGRGELECIHSQQAITSSIFLVLPKLYIFTKLRC